MLYVVRGAVALRQKGMDEMAVDYKRQVTMDPSGFVLLSDYVPGIVQEIRYFSTYNFVGDRIDGYEQPCALITVDAARAAQAMAGALV